MNQSRTLFHIESAQRDISAAIDIGRGKMDRVLAHKMHAATLIDELLVNASDSINAALKSFDTNSLIADCGVVHQSEKQKLHDSEFFQGVEVIA